MRERCRIKQISRFYFLQIKLLSNEDRVISKRFAYKREKRRALFSCSQNKAASELQDSIQSSRRLHPSIHNIET